MRNTVIFLTFFVVACSSGPPVRCLTEWCDAYVSAGYFCQRPDGHGYWDRGPYTCQPTTPELENSVSYAGAAGGGYLPGYVDPSLQRANPPTVIYQPYGDGWVGYSYPGYTGY